MELPAVHGKDELEGRKASGQSTAVDAERAKRLMAMGQMAASLAHEIRNPLGSMELYCSLLKKDLQDRPDLQTLAEQIHVGIKTLDRIIGNCLQFSRGIEPKKEPVPSLMPVLEAVAEMVRAKADGVKIEITSSSLPVVLDTYLFKQALCNLVLNAAEAAKETAAEPLVSINAQVDERGGIVVEVIDNGPGIPEASLKEIFEPFFTTKRGGTGLGMAVVLSIVSAHGGSVSVENRETVSGVRAVISIPAARQ
jgi:signal transduction histidine kinase